MRSMRHFEKYSPRGGGGGGLWRVSEAVNCKKASAFSKNSFQKRVYNMEGVIYVSVL